MTSQIVLSDSGSAALKQVVYIRDFLDYHAFLESDRNSNPAAPLTAETAALFKREWVSETLKKLVADFNGNPADVQTAALLFKITLEPADSKIKAKDLAARALTVKDGSSDLKAALARIKASRLSKRGKDILSQVLYIRDYLDYYVFLREGDKSKGIPAPLDPEIARIFANDFSLAMRQVLARFNANPQDAQATAELFGFELSGPLGLEVKAKDLAAVALKVKHDSTDRQIVIAQIERHTLAQVKLSAASTDDPYLDGLAAPATPAPAPKQREAVRINPSKSETPGTPSRRPVDLGGLGTPKVKGPNGGSTGDDPAAPAAKPRTGAPKSAWQDDGRRTALARRTAETAIKNGLNAEFRTGVVGIESGAALITISIATTGKITVTDVTILSHFSINGAVQSDQDMQRWIAKYLNRVKFPDGLGLYSKTTTLTHQLAFPQI